MQFIALYLGIGLIVWSLARIVRNRSERRQFFKDKLYSILAARITRAKPNLVQRYIRIVKEHGVGSDHAEDFKRLYDHDPDLMSFCQNFDTIERTL